MISIIKKLQKYIKYLNCKHDYLIILKDDYTVSPPEIQNEFKCTFCGDIKNELELKKLGLEYWS